MVIRWHRRIALELAADAGFAGDPDRLNAAGQPETLITAADLADAGQNRARRATLAATRGYGENRDVFENFPPASASDAAQQIRRGIKVFGVSHGRFSRAARAVERGELFLPLTLAGRRRDRLICLDGHLRLTAYALAGFPRDVKGLVGTARAMDRWEH